MRAPSNPPGRESKQVFLLSEIHPFRTALANLLGATGWDVVAVSNSQEALAWLSGSDDLFDLVICDLVVDHDSGPDFARDLFRGKAAKFWFLVDPSRYLPLEIAETVSQNDLLLGCPVTKAQLDQALRALGGEKVTESDFSDERPKWSSHKL